MKGLDVKRIIRVSAFVLGLAVITVLPTSAQTNANSNVTRTDTNRVVERDNDFDWGWLGLLGLLGLTGLIPKKRAVEVREHQDTTTNRPVSGTGNNL